MAELVLSSVWLWEWGLWCHSSRHQSATCCTDVLWLI